MNRILAAAIALGWTAAVLAAPMNTANRTTGVAPLGVFFDAVGNPPLISATLVPQPYGYADLNFEWSFGDDASAVWANTGRSKDEAIGFVAAHVYENPGTYVVTLRVTMPDGTQSNYDQNITVTDPNFVFANSSNAAAERTVYVSSSGNDSGNGSFGQPFRTLGRGLSWLFASDGPKRLLLRRGDSFPGGVGIFVSGRTGPYTIGAFGTGANPILIFNEAGATEPLRFAETATDIRMMDLDIRGPLTGNAITPGVNMLVLRTSISGAGSGILTGDDSHDRSGVFLVDSTVKECDMFGIHYEFGQHVAMLGNLLEGVSRQHVMRSYLTHSLIQQNLFRGGAVGKNQLRFSGFRPSNDPQRAPETPTEVLEYSIISDNVFEPSDSMSEIIAIGPDGTSNDQRISNVVFERNILLAGATVTNALALNNSLITVRNNVFDLTGSVSSASAVRIAQRGSEPPPSHHRIVQNTMYRGDGLSLIGVQVDSISQSAILRNNLISGETATAVLGQGTGMQSGRNMQLCDAGLEDPAHGLFQLRPSSPAVDRGMFLSSVFSDFSGVPRPIDGDVSGGAQSDVGAFEYSPLRGLQMRARSMQSPPSLPLLTVQPEWLSFSATTNSLTFQVWNSGLGVLEYTIAEPASWLTVSPASGSSTGEHDIITATVNRGVLPDGFYTSEVTVTPSIGTSIDVFISMAVGAVELPMSVATRTSGPAPLGVVFDVSNGGSGVSLPPLLDGQPDHASFRYRWDFGDPRGQTWPVHGKSKNEATGHLAAHVFETPGVFRVTLQVTDGTGATRSYEQPITVSDPDVLFANTCADCAERTFYVSGTGDDNNNGSFNRPLRTWAQGKSRLFAGSGPRRLLLRRGDTFVSSTSGNGPAFAGPILISAYGTGADPIISGQSASSLLPLGNGDDLTVANLRFVSTYNPSTGYGLHPDGIVMLNTNSRITLHRNSFSNIGIGIFVSQLGELRDSVVSENSATAWQNYGILTGEVSRAAFLGNTVRQAANASTGDAKGPTPPEPDLPDHGPMRLRDSYKALVAHNDLFSNTGWSLGAGSTPTNPIYAHQPCLRIGGAGTADLSIVADNVMEGGAGITGAGPANDSLEAVIGRVIWERNKLIATSNTRDFIGLALGGAVIRNNLFLQPIVNGQSRTVISFEIPPLSSALNRTALNRVYANSYVTLTAQERSSFLEVSDNAMRNIEVLNNLVSGPGINSSPSSFINWQNSTAGPAGLVSDYNLYYSNSSVFVNYLGTNYGLAAWRTFQGDDGHSLVGDPLLVDPLRGDYHLRTGTPGSPAINAGANITSQFDDFAGSVRPSDTRPPLGRQDIGAFEAP